MNYRFVKIKENGLDYGWMLEVATLEELIDWFKVHCNSIARGIIDFMRSEDFEKVIHGEVLPPINPKKIANHHHVETAYGSLAYMYTSLDGLNDEPKKFKYLDMVDRLTKKVTDHKLQCLLEGYTLYINKVGGWFPKKKPLNNLGEIISEELIFPEYTEADIKITQWEGGKHFYAKIGDMDVVWDGNQKWITEDRARENAIKFLNKIYRRY
ncbi:MAG: hypothetical protein WC783_04260 [Candidatus Paceibacterota bacterium]|jgi:hypothetical protein